jgi:hypothetical protein
MVKWDLYFKGTGAGDDLFTIFSFQDKDKGFKFYDSGLKYSRDRAF